MQTLRNLSLAILAAMPLLTAQSRPPLSLFEDFHGTGTEDVRLSPATATSFSVSRGWADGRIASLGSTGSFFTTDPTHNGPLAVRRIEDDFRMTVRVGRRRGTYDNEGGLIALCTTADGTQASLRIGKTTGDSVAIVLSTATAVRRTAYAPVGGDTTVLCMEGRNGTVLMMAGPDGNHLKVLSMQALPAPAEGTKTEAGLYQRAGYGRDSYVEFGPFEMYY